jgi:pyruvate kinase
MSILEGVDAFLLDLETSVFKNPIECVQIVSDALAESETLVDVKKRYA